MKTCKVAMVVVGGVVLGGIALVEGPEGSAMVMTPNVAAALEVAIAVEEDAARDAAALVVDGVELEWDVDMPALDLGLALLGRRPARTLRMRVEQVELLG